MPNRPEKDIYRKTRARGLSFSHVCEVGVYLPETSNIIDFISNGIKATLVEADPDTVIKIKKFFAGKDIVVHSVAVFDREGTIKLSRAAASTFVSDLPASPALVNDQYQIKESDTFEVPCKKFSSLDDSTIELLSVDIEGAEWYVIQDLVSRPKVISIETHGKAYVNPFMSEISAWLDSNNYIIWYKDLSDSIYVKKGLLQPSGGDKFETFVIERRVAWKKFKQSFKKIFRGNSSR